MYRSLLWGAAHTEKATSVTSRAGNKSEERMMATGKKIEDKQNTGESEWQLGSTQGTFVLPILPFGKAEQFSSLTLTAEVG